MGRRGVPVVATSSGEGRRYSASPRLAYRSGSAALLPALAALVVIAALHDRKR
jgi:hypothetical protein